MRKSKWITILIPDLISKTTSCTSWDVKIMHPEKNNLLLWVPYMMFSNAMRKVTASQVSCIVRKEQLCSTSQFSYLVYRVLTASLQSTRNFSITRIVCGLVKSVSSPNACQKVLFLLARLSLVHICECAKDLCRENSTFKSHHSQEAIESRLRKPSFGESIGTTVWIIKYLKRNLKLLTPMRQWSWRSIL